MPTPIQLIVGLGNPGAKYAGTRHNAGAWFVEALAASVGCSLRPALKLHGLHALTTVLSQDCHLLLPTTYMNDSGVSVRAAANYYKIPPEAILVIHDEIDLAPGAVRLKFDGGSGGHNGLKDIISHLQSPQFYRLRIGVGHPGKSEEVVNYVLNPPSKVERENIHAAIADAEEVLPLILEGNFSKAMQRLHSNKEE